MPEPVSTTEDLDALQVDKAGDVRQSVKSIDATELEESIDQTGVKVLYLDTPVKSRNDKKDYRVIKFPNGLTVLLISDIQTVSGDQIYNVDHKDDDHECTEREGSQSEIRKQEKKEDDTIADDPSNGDVDSSENNPPIKEEKMAACGICIGVGSFSDPPEIPGMAHFLEHMVFMGSDKYPQENDFDAFVKKHGGSFNASTNSEHTTFYVEIQEKHLFGALDRFAQFFISPLLKRDAITREREAIDSEFQLVVPSHYCQWMKILGSLTQSGHPAAKFIWGNLVTLRDNVTEDKLYEELHRFRERHYSAHRMTLSLQARLPMDTLEQYVKNCFSAIPNNGLPPDDFTQFKGIQSFDTPNFRRIYKIKPVKDVCEIELTWTMPSLHHLYKCKPHQYVSWIIGHEGKGSLISYLRKKMWCLDLFNGLVKNGFQHSSMYALFSLTLVMTDNGREHLKEVLDAVFSYISLMRKCRPQKRIFDEIHQIYEISFRFRDEASASQYVTNLSEDMHFYAPSDYITGSELYFEYNPTEIKACMDALTPDSVNIVLFDHKFNDAEFDKVEPWFNTKYTDMEIPSNWIEDWQKIESLPDFHLPEPNIFITNDFSLVPLPEDVPKYPTKIHSDAMSEVWFRPDAKFKIPESYMYYQFISPLALKSPENAALMDLLVTIVMRLLVEELYPANVAELRYCIYAVEKGIEVTLTGLSQKLPLLLSTVIRYIADCANLVTQNLFDIMKAETLKGYYNTFVEPQCLSSDVNNSILGLTYWTAVDKHAALPGVDLSQFKSFAKQFCAHIYMKCLVHGNITKEDVIKSSQNCIEILKCKCILPNTSPQLRITQIPLGVRCCRVKNYNKADVNSVITNYYQSGIGNVKLSVIVQLLMMLMEEPVFNQLRTQEQLGYSVGCYADYINGILAYAITVCTQADKFTTEHVDERIENFLKSFRDILKKMSEKELSTVKIALIKLKQCVDLSLCDETIRNWVEITTGDYMFDRRDREIHAINGTTIVELRKWMDQHVLDGTNLRKLSIQIVGKSREKDEIKNESIENDKIMNNSEKSTRSIKTSDNKIVDSSDTSMECTNNVKFPLDYVMDMPEEKKAKPSKYYITDIEEYKKSLYVYPVTCTATY